MTYLGDFLPTQIVTARFNTVDATGLPVTLSGSPAAQVRQGSGTGVVIVSGVTLTLNVVTGSHCVDVNLSSSASYAPGEYCIELLAGTVSGISVAGLVIAAFSIANRVVNVGKINGTPVNGNGTTQPWGP